MASDLELKKIKKKYGEKFMHMCRELFPTILEEEGALLSILEKTFSNNSRTLYEDIHDNCLEGEFKDFIYRMFDIDKSKDEEITHGKTPYELLDEVGYTLYECKTEEDIQRFKKYFSSGEELCTFRGGRLNTCLVFFAVKKDADEIKRENFKNPQREDEYGTSVMSIQFYKTGMCMVSIKNRYNHMVNNPDATYGNDLDRIIPGLSQSFEKLLGERGLEFNKNNIERFFLPRYVVADDGKYYKYNLEIDGNYYCPGNIVIFHGEAISIGSPEKKILVENFGIDLVEKEIIQYGIQHHAEGYGYIGEYRDSFTDNLQDIEKIEIVKGKEGTRVINIKKRGSKYPIKIIIDRDNQIIGYINEELESVGNYFLKFNKELSLLGLPNLTRCGNGFLSHNIGLKDLELPNLKIAGNEFLSSNLGIIKLGLPNLMKVFNDFLKSNSSLTCVKLPKLLAVGDSFLEDNEILSQLELPQLTVVGSYFLRHNTGLTQLNLPKLEMVDSEFLALNTDISCIKLPRLRSVGNHFLLYNTNIVQLEIPNLEEVSNNFLEQNEILSQLELPHLIAVGSCFLRNNRELTSLRLPSLKEAGNSFLGRNDIISDLDLPNLMTVRNNFLFSNKALTALSLPKLEEAGDNFLFDNNLISYVELPMLQSFDTGFLWNYRGLKYVNQNGQFVFEPFESVEAEKLELLSPMSLSKLDKESKISSPEVDSGRRIINMGKDVLQNNK